MWNRSREKWKKLYQRLTLRTIIWIGFSISAALATVSMGLSFYSRFSNQMKMQLQQNQKAMIGQVNAQLTFYLANLMKMEDTLAFNTIKEVDLSVEDVTANFEVLYETNRDSIKNIALFDEDGRALTVAPAAAVKPYVDIKGQEWYQEALAKPENVHFTQPHVQNLFTNQEYTYEWVVSMSRMVEITKGNQVKKGVLLIDLTYDGLKQLVGNVSFGEKGYMYLMDRKGNLIYHPKRQLILMDRLQESNQQAAGRRDGNYKEKLNGQGRQITMKTVGYTGWKLVAVIPDSEAQLSQLKNHIFVVFLFLFFLTIVIMMNSAISNMVAKPIGELEQSVRELEKGNFQVEVRSRGFYEVWHLGTAIQKMAGQIQKLMKDIVLEHQAKTKSEMDSLQAQINPHFLYNTLDIIVWMIENEQKQQAARVVTALARFFRISLSKGRQIITVEDELEHVNNYLMIQKMRFKNRFEYVIEIEEDAKGLSTLKLVLQPLVENAIYHGMEFMDGDGLIQVKAYIKEGNLILSVQDNGLGMSEEQVRQLQEGKVKSTGKGSGIAFSNVNERIRLHFGKHYGILVESEPDEGTTMRIILPIKPYEEWEDEGEA